MKNSNLEFVRALIREMNQSYDKSGLKKPHLADLNKDKKISSYEKKRGSAIEKNVKNESHPRNEQWLEQFYSALEAELQNKPELQDKVKNVLEIMGDAGIIDMYGMFQPYVAVTPFLGDVDELENHYQSGLQETHEGQDHEVSMANNSLDSILWAVGELKKQLGDQERDIPAWIQDHITNAENFITQAAKNFHDYSGEEEMQEPTEEPAKDMSLASLMEVKKKAAIKLPKKKATKKK